MMPTEAIIITIFAVVTLILAFWLARTEMRLKKMLRGKNARDLEDVITELVASVTMLEKNDATIEATLGHMESRLRKSIQGIETIRFNPFKDSGGNHSFATALLSEDGDGVVLSSLYARDRVNIFAKPIKKHVSDFELTAEEKEALKLVQGKHK
jgi:hypothetical protein